MVLSLGELHQNVQVRAFLPRVCQLLRMDLVPFADWLIDHIKDSVGIQYVVGVLPRLLSEAHAGRDVGPRLLFPLRHRFASVLARFANRVLQRIPVVGLARQSLVELFNFIRFVHRRHRQRLDLRGSVPVLGRQHGQIHGGAHFGSRSFLGRRRRLLDIIMRSFSCPHLAFLDKLFLDALALDAGARDALFLQALLVLPPLAGEVLLA